MAFEILAACGGIRTVYDTSNLLFDSLLPLSCPITTSITKSSKQTENIQNINEYNIPKISRLPFPHACAVTSITRL
jgi:hypothetical protein